MSPVWRIRLFIFLLTLMAAGMGYLYFTQRLTPEERLALQPTPIPTSSPTPLPEIVNFAQIIAVPFDVSADSEASSEAVLNFISNNKPGFVVLFGDQISTQSANAAVTDILDETHSADRPLLAIDHEGGRVQRFNGTGFTRVPTWRRVCDQTSEQRRALLATSAAELKAVGINIVFAPVVDVADSNAVLRDRVCSGDPEVVAESALDFISAFEEQKIYSVIKHYPGLGSATVDTHNALGSVLITEKDIQPFKSVLDKYSMMGVMTAHIAVENQSSNIPCSLSVSCVTQLFELYPDVIAFTDALEMAAARYNPSSPKTEKSLATVSIEAIMAGNTVLVFGQDVSVEELDKVLARIKQEYTGSSEFRDRVNKSVAKIEELRKNYLPVSEEVEESEAE